MKKFFILTLFIFILASSSVFAVCYNQDNSPFCSKDDPICVQDTEADTDNDGWSDSCDAFADDELFQVDYDGDGIGYGADVYDCDDLDDTSTTYCGDTSLLDEEEIIKEDSVEEVVEVITTTRSSTRRPIIYVSDPNAPREEPQEEIIEGVVSGEEFENDPITLPKKPAEVEKEFLPVEETESNQITGAVIGGGFINTWPLWILFILIMSLLFLVWMRRKKEAAAPAGA